MKSQIENPRGKGPKLLDQVRNKMRLHHYSIHTERSASVLRRGATLERRARVEVCARRGRSGVAMRRLAPWLGRPVG